MVLKVFVDTRMIEKAEDIAAYIQRVHSVSMTPGNVYDALIALREKEMLALALGLGEHLLITIKGRKHLCDVGEWDEERDDVRFAALMRGLTAGGHHPDVTEVVNLLIESVGPEVRKAYDEIRSFPKSNGKADP